MPSCHSSCGFQPRLSAFGHKFDDVFARLDIVLVLVVVLVLGRSVLLFEDEDENAEDEDDSQINVIVLEATRTKRLEPGSTPPSRQGIA